MPKAQSKNIKRALPGIEPGPFQYRTKEWSWEVSILLPRACKARALPSELQPLIDETKFHLQF